jgi:hypothetical protein
MVGEPRADNFPRARGDVCPDIISAPSREILDDGQANRANGLTFLAVVQSRRHLQ